MLNKDIVNSLARARRIHAKIRYSIYDLIEMNGKLTFADVKTIANSQTVEGSILNVALIRIIESEHIITLEVK
jgi:hypothetical protein